MPSDPLPYDAILLYSFGGPNGPADVLPFLRNVTRGKHIPEARLVEVGAHYDHFGGRSPINGHNLELIAALHEELGRRGVDLPIGFGNRNWEPYTVDALADLRAGGARRVLAIVTSAYGSYSGCRQYRENLAATLAALAAQPAADDAAAVPALVVDKLRHYFNHPGFVQANAEAIADAYAALRARREAGAGAAGGGAGDAASAAPLVFVTHSIPDVMEEGSGAQRPSYAAQHLDVAALVAARVAELVGHAVPWRLAFCSRSGPPSQPWLEPDVNDVLKELSGEGVRSVVLSPIGFISDHMEVAFDLDTEAMETAAELGLTAVRAGTVSTRPAFVAGLVDLVLERAARERGEDVEPVAVGALGAWPDVCRAGCCRQRAGVDSGVPAACGEDSDPTEWTAS
ncbi:ferrochelatase [Pengzhenrongella sicca]|nr:ferrochelatase [Pengzhenrongella sicca]